MEKAEQKFLSVLTIKNEKGILGKISTKLGDNGVNIESMSLNAINRDETLQKITLHTTGAASIPIIKTVAMEMPAVLNVFTFDERDTVIEKEICLVKVKNANPAVKEIVDLLSKENALNIYTDNIVGVYQIIGSVNEISELLKSIDDISKDVDVSRSMVLTLLY